MVAGFPIYVAPGQKIHSISPLQACCFGSFYCSFKGPYISRHGVSCGGLADSVHLLTGGIDSNRMNQNDVSCNMCQLQLEWVDGSYIHAQQYHRGSIRQAPLRPACRATPRRTFEQSDVFRILWATYTSPKGVPGMPLFFIENWSASERQSRYTKNIDQHMLPRVGPTTLDFQYIIPQ